MKIYLIGFVVGMLMAVGGYFYGMECFNYSLVTECSNFPGWVSVIGTSFSLIFLGGWIAHKYVSRRARN